MYWRCPLACVNCLTKFVENQQINVWEMLQLQCRKTSYLTMLRKVEKWSCIHIWNRINSKISKLLEGHPLPMPTKFKLGWHRHIRLHVREWSGAQTDRHTHAHPHRHTLLKSKIRHWKSRCNCVYHFSGQVLHATCTLVGKRDEIFHC